MALKWVRPKTKEVLIAETEPQIAALWSSSDHSPNITQGQDFGWRLAPEVVVEMRSIQEDIVTMERIAARYHKSLEDLTEIDILHWISDKTSRDKAPMADMSDAEDDYQAEIRRLERNRRKTIPVTAEGEE